jgi:hypothetical protein
MFCAQFQQHCCMVVDDSKDMSMLKKEEQFDCTYDGC